MSGSQQQLQSLSDEYQKLQQGLEPTITCKSWTDISPEMNTYVATRQKLESQQQENLGVQREFGSLADEANIYKLVGPVLLKQEKTEAVLAVKGRLDFIEGEM